MLRRQLPAIRPWLCLALMVAIVSGAVSLVVHYGTTINVEVLTVDPVAEVGLPPYVGIFSHIGVLMLWSGASVCLLGWHLLRRSGGNPDVPQTLLTFGLLLGWLAVDDLFLLHEEIGRAAAEALGRPSDRSLFEAPVFLVYGAFWLLWMVRYRSMIARTPFVLLTLGMATLGASIAIDLGEFIFPGVAGATPWMATTLNMAEELAKLVGILLMLGYAAVSATMVIQRVVAPDGARETATRQGGVQA